MPKPGREKKNAESWLLVLLSSREELMPGSWTAAVDLAKLEERLAADSERQIRAVLAVQVDTASGIKNDIEAIGAMMRRSGHDALFFVDAVACFAVHEMRMDAWKVDGVITASQKGLMVPPGLGLLCAGPRALAAHRAETRPGTGLSSRYWDWTFRQQKWHYFKFCGTLPEQLLFGLREALDMLKREGLEHALARQRHCAEAVRRAVAVWAQGSDGAISFQVPKPEHRSDAVTVMRISEEYDPRELVKYCEIHFDVVLGNAIGLLGGKGLRIASMGHVGLPQVLAVLGAVEATLGARQVPHGPGGVSAAVAYFGQVAAASSCHALDNTEKHPSVIVRTKC
ncbi:unnamed protein product [Polarella glacialis]|uniref:alanine--glyoxylate transaminase n=1 Tax=Polarella glacialis TaxID=89957 RepID=A0A813GWN6_POLGL|nr:unnamed protein product [Polarella glacialis]